MELQFKITFKQGTREVGSIIGRRPMPARDLTIEEVTQQVQETEQFLEKLTGLRVHIEQVL